MGRHCGQPAVQQKGPGAGKALQPGEAVCRAPAAGGTAGQGQEIPPKMQGVRHVPHPQSAEDYGNGRDRQSS